MRNLSKEGVDESQRVSPVPLRRGPTANAKGTICFIQTALFSVPREKAQPFVVGMLASERVATTTRVSDQRHIAWSGQRVLTIGLVSDMGDLLWMLFSRNNKQLWHPVV